ncbi:MAG TPA: crosslink repair DNA glycosylase YcaQ family protein [Kofleriaceae bacterium]|nr:crosslink repair DNA glycosylase YcaQ family protein [Kofleriaceae bacterium]
MIELARARAFWFRRQGLASPSREDPAKVIRATGWLRTLGGADVYLAARARTAALDRASMDRAVANDQLRVIPAVRGCIYLVPGVDVPWVLRLAEEAWRPRTEREVEKVGATWKEVEALAKLVEKALAKPMTTDAIRRALPDGAVRSLGDAGKKLGMSSLLPIALRLLEFADRIERTLDGGRLDTERYTWRVVRDRAPVTGDPRAKLAETFFAHNGPARVTDFASWAAWSQRDAKAAMASIDLASVTVEGLGDAFVLARDRAALESAEPSDAIALLSFEDNFLVAHGGPALVTDPAYHAVELMPWGSGKPEAIGTANHIASRTIVAGGQVVGLWELDEPAKAGVWAPLGARAVDAKRAKEIEARVQDAAHFLLDELGHGKSFSLDTSESIADRAAQIKLLRGKRAASASPSGASRSSRAPTASASRRGSTRAAPRRSRTRG